MSKISNRSARSVSESHTHTASVPVTHPRICLHHPTLSTHAHDHAAALASCPVAPVILVDPDDRVIQLRKKTARPEITCFARPDDARDFNQPVFSVYDFNAAMIAVSSVVQGKTDSAVTPFGLIAERHEHAKGPETTVWYDHVVQWDAALETVVDPLMIYTSEQRSFLPDEPLYSPSTIPRSRRAPVAPRAVTVRVPIAVFMASHVVLFTRWDLPNDRKDLAPCISHVLNTLIGSADPLAYLAQSPSSSQDGPEVVVSYLPPGYLDAYPTVHLPLYARMVECLLVDTLNPMNANASASASASPTTGSSRGRGERSRSRSRSPGRAGNSGRLMVPGDQSGSGRSAASTSSSARGSADVFCRCSFIALDDERKGGLATLMVVATPEATDVVNLRLGMRQGRDAVAVRRRLRDASSSHRSSNIPITLSSSDSSSMIIRSPSVDIIQT